MSNSAETGLEETHLDPVSVETPTAGSSQLSVTPQEAFEQLPAAVQAEVSHTHQAHTFAPFADSI